MSTITAILEPDADGTLHLKLPEILRHGKMRVVATPVEEEEKRDAPLTPEEESAMMKSIEELRMRAGLRRRELPPEEQERRRQAALAALRQIRESNPYLEIADPVACQREIHH